MACQNQCAITLAPMHSDQSLWSAVDAFWERHLLADDAVLDAALADARAAGLPAAEVSPSQGRLLYLLARSHGARRILELGTLAGYSTIWLARALPPDGRVVTLEREPAHAAVARANLERARLADRVELHVGPALETLPRLEGERFDLAFLDADKASADADLDQVLELLRPGGMLIADNVVRGGSVIGSGPGDPSTEGIRRLAARLAAEPRLEATAIQTVGAKGHDGFVLALLSRS
jgi:predicted O-methyltransferase YrrM